MRVGAAWDAQSLRPPPGARTADSACASSRGSSTQRAATLGALAIRGLPRSRRSSAARSMTRWRARGTLQSVISSMGRGAPCVGEFNVASVGGCEHARRRSLRPPARTLRTSRTSTTPTARPCKRCKPGSSPLFLRTLPQRASCDTPTLRRLCKSWLEHDRMLYAIERGYSCQVCRMHVEEATPKNHILYGWPAERPPPPGGRARPQPGEVRQ